VLKPPEITPDCPKGTAHPIPTHMVIRVISRAIRAIGIMLFRGLLEELLLELLGLLGLLGLFTLKHVSIGRVLEKRDRNQGPTITVRSTLIRVIRVIRVIISHTSGLSGLLYE